MSLLLKGEVERVHYDPSERRELLVMLRNCPHAPNRGFLEMSVDSDLKRSIGSHLRLTQTGDLVQLQVSTSSNGVHSLVGFENLTLAWRMG